MQSSQGRTTSGRTFRVQLDVPRALVVLLLLASFAEVRSKMRCAGYAEMRSDCIYEGCATTGDENDRYRCGCRDEVDGCTYYCTDFWFGGYCPERPCLAGTYNDVSSCVSGGLGRGGGTDCSCTTCPAGKYSNVSGSTACVECGPGKSWISYDAYTI